MSDKLEEARKIINEVDSQMAELFVRRMRAAEMVCEYKMELGLPVLSLGHYASETVGVKAVIQDLNEKFDIECEFIDIQTGL